MAAVVKRRAVKLLRRRFFFVAGFPKMIEKELQRSTL